MEIFERSLEENIEIIHQLLAHNRMTRFRTEFLALHNYDRAQIFAALEVDDRNKIYQYLSPTELADIFDMLENEDDSVIGYFDEMSNSYAASLLGAMYSDNAVDVLNSLKDRNQVNIYLHLMPVESAREISKLMSYMEETAGAIMTSEFISIPENITLGDAYRKVRKQAAEAETIYYVYVVDEEGRLTGVLSLRDLIVNEEDKQVKDFMNNRVITVQVNDNQEEVAQMVQDYDLLALPVVGFDQVLLGLITVDDIMDVIREEADSDYSGLAAVDVSEQHLSPFSAAKSRLPWLITLLFLGMGTSTVISQYQDVIASASILSAFVTLITGTAGNAGTQSLAVAVRKLTNKSEEDDFTSSLSFELLTGAITGSVVGLAVMVIVLVWQHNLFLGAIIGFAMMMAIIVANLAGSLIPKLMDRIGFDPAVASGPFISTLSDLTSVFIYFSIASFFLNLIQ